MQQDFKNYTYFLGNLKTADKKQYRIYFATHLGKLILSVLFAFLGVWLPAEIVAVVLAGGPLWALLLPILAFALNIFLLNLVNGTDFFTEMTLRFREIVNGVLQMMGLPAEKMSGAFGRDALNKTNYAVYRGNNYGMEEYFRQSWALLEAVLIAIVFFAMSVRFSPFWFLIIALPSLLKERLKRGYYQLREDTKDQAFEMFMKRRYFERAALDNEAAKDIRLYHLQDLFAERQTEQMRRDYAYEDALHKKETFYDRLGILIFLVRDVLSVWLLIRGLQGGMPVEEFVLYLTLLPAAGKAVADIFRSAIAVKGFRGEVTDYRELQELPHYDAGDYPAHLPEGPADICFERVSYSYGDKEVFHDLNLTIRAGEKLALVGSNGAGKTTLAKLAAGIFTPDAGRITIGGVDLQDVNPKERYDYATLVFQDVFLMAMTLAENVAGEPLDKLDRDRVWQALEEADLKDFVKTLPRGIDTPMTTYVNPEGLELSGGQQQRLVLARALYKGGELLILDEPTSALDPLAEAALYKEYLRFTADKTSVFISHRLSSTQFCDRIVFLEDGEIKETGDHRSLMAEKGLYYDMFQTQAKYYRDELQLQEAF